MSCETSILFADLLVHHLKFLNSTFEIILVILLPHAASDSTLTILHPPKNSLSILRGHLLSGLLIFMRVLVIGEVAVLIFNSLLEVLALLVREALEFIDGGLIAADGSVIIAACGNLGCVEGDSLLLPSRC